MIEEKHSSGAILFKKDNTEKAVDRIDETLKDLQKQISALKSRCTKLEKALEKNKD